MRRKGQLKYLAKGVMSRNIEMRGPNEKELFGVSDTLHSAVSSLYMYRGEAYLNFLRTILDL
jgi:hypothetical protein